uniref:HAT C-terminal dimerisation domain-containing protein n=1 Tax=Meloidogyne javanica TaxID=6303 RepID=A0A915MDM0_MELJA
MREQDHIKPLIRNGLSYLAIPGTTAPIERVFSLSGLATKGIMNRTEEKLLNANCSLLRTEDFDFLLGCSAWK